MSALPRMAKRRKTDYADTEEMEATETPRKKVRTPRKKKMTEEDGDDEQDEDYVEPGKKKKKSVRTPRKMSTKKIGDEDEQDEQDKAVAEVEMKATTKTLALRTKMVNQDVDGKKNDDGHDADYVEKQKTPKMPKTPRPRKTSEVYNSAQKAAIGQFVSFTQLDKNTAARVLRSHNWDANAAVTAYYGGGGNSNAASPAKASINKIFDAYRENPASEPDAVGIEGTMKYFQDIDVDLEGLESFAALEVVNAPAMGEMNREGFVNGWIAANCDTIDKQKSYIKNLKRQLPGDQEHFDGIYKYVFSLGLTGTSKQAALDQALAFWEVLFSSPIAATKWTSPSTPWLEWWTEFLTTKHKKSVTKDMWNQTLKFAKLTLSDEAMTFWNEEASWPAVIDEFVDWVKNDKRGGAKEEAMDEDY